MMNTIIVVDKTWQIAWQTKGIQIVKTHEEDENGKRIPHTILYGVEDENDVYDYFDTLAEAKRYVEAHF